MMKNDYRWCLLVRRGFLGWHGLIESLICLTCLICV